MALEVLEELGLTKSEISVYLALLEIGQATTGPIVDKAKISSSKIYEILEKLLKKGLVSYVLKGKIKYFEATQPDRILDLLKEKEEKLEQQRNEIKKLLPELTQKRDLSKYRENASIYRGMKGLETVFYEAIDIMKKSDSAYVIGIPSRSESVNRFFAKWNKYRSSKGIKELALFNEAARGELQTLPENSPLTEIRYMPEGIITPAAINIFGNRTLIFPKETSEQPLLIVLESKDIADSFRAQFNLLWNMQTKVLTGVEGPKLVIKELLKNKGEALSFGLDETKFKKYMPEELNKLVDYENEYKIPTKLLFIQGYSVPSSKHAKIKYLPKSYASPLHYEIYENKVVIINWDSPITTIITENKNMADSFRIYFNNLWRIAHD